MRGRCTFPIDSHWLHWSSRCCIASVCRLHFKPRSFPKLIGILLIYIVWRASFFGGADAKVFMALWLVLPEPAWVVAVLIFIIAHGLIARLFFRSSHLPALLPTALGVWMYVLSSLIGSWAA